MCWGWNSENRQEVKMFVWGLLTGARLLVLVELESFVAVTGEGAWRADTDLLTVMFSLSAQVNGCTTHTHSYFPFSIEGKTAGRPCCSIFFCFILFFKEMTLKEDARLASEASTALDRGWRALATSQIRVPTFYCIQPPEVWFRKTMNKTFIQTPSGSD